MFRSLFRPLPRTAVDLLRLRCLMVSFLWVVSSPASSQAFLFAPLERLGSSDASDVVAGDFNGDGLTDAFFCYGSKRAIARLQDSSGRLVTAHDGLIWGESGNQSAECRAMMVEDLDSDGRDDVVILHSRGISTFLSKAGGFERMEHEIIYQQIENVVFSGGLIDVDDDGQVDLVGHSVNGRIRLWKAISPGQWQPEVDFAQAEGLGESSVGVIDVGNDGHDDFVVLSRVFDSNPPSVLEVFVRTPEGFVARPPMRVPGGGVQLTVGDVNSDGRDDLVANGVVVYEQGADGSFASPRRYESFPSPTASVIDDFNGDGLPDVAVSHNGWDIVSTYRQTSDGLELQTYNRGLTNLGSQRQALAAGDFDSDGCRDIVAAVGGGYHLLRGIDCIGALDAGLSTDEKVLRGSWYEPETSGQGVMIDVVTKPDGEKIVYLGWYTFRGVWAYGPSTQQWLVGQGISDPKRNSATGLIEQTLDLYVPADGGGQFNRPPVADVQRVGSMTLQLVTNTEIRAKFHFDVVHQRWETSAELWLTKLPDHVPVVQPGRGLRGTWFNPETSGQGVMFDVIATGGDARTIFGSWYTYDRMGKPLWLVLQGAWQEDASVQEVGVFLSSGGLFNRPPVVTPQRIGTARVRLVDRMHLDIQVDFAGADARWQDTQLNLLKLDAR